MGVKGMVCMDGMWMFVWVEVWVVGWYSLTLDSGGNAIGDDRPVSFIDW